jgi:hypothetical protein
MVSEKIGRDGKISKRGLGPIALHGGMYHLRNGQMIRGVSRTQAAHPIDDSKIVTAPSVEKRLAPVEIVPGQRSRRNDPAS